MTPAQQALREMRQNTITDNFLNGIRMQYRHAKGGAGQHKAWRRFVEGAYGRTLRYMAEHEPAKLDFMRDIFAELVG